MPSALPEANRSEPPMLAEAMIALTTPETDGDARTAHEGLHLFFSKADRCVLFIASIGSEAFGGEQWNDEERNVNGPGGARGCQRTADRA